MATALESLNLEGGKSEELRAVFSCIAEASAPDGGPKYGKDICRLLSRVIVCRSYAKPTLELSHLLAALDRNGIAYIDLMWGVERATTSAFRAFLKSLNQQGTLSRAIRSNAIRYESDGTVFDVSYSRIPFLVIFAEFLITALGFDAFDAFARSLSRSSSSPSAVVATARDMQAALYGYLQDHLPPVQRQRRERHFLAFIEQRAGSEAAATAINDESVLAYWCTHADDPNQDVKTFRSVYESSARLIVALSAAAERMAADRASIIGTDVQAGEVDPEDMDYIVATISASGSRIKRIQDMCGGVVKLLNGVEADVLSEIPDDERIISQLPKSVLRNAVYGAVQLRLIAGVRDGAANFADVLPTASGQEYATRLDLYSKHLERLRKLCVAAVFVLHKHRLDTGISAALRLAPNNDWGALTGEEREDIGANVVSLENFSAGRAFFDTAIGDKANPISSFLREARRQYHRTNREGFRDPEDAGAAEIMSDVIEEAIALHTSVSINIEKYLRRTDLARVEVEDAGVFRDVFMRLYPDKQRASEG